MKELQKNIRKNVDTFLDGKISQMFLVFIDTIDPPKLKNIIKLDGSTNNHLIISERSGNDKFTTHFKSLSIKLLEIYKIGTSAGLTSAWHDNKGPDLQENNLGYKGSELVGFDFT